MPSVNKEDAQPKTDRFWSKVQRGNKTACWHWLGAKKPSGYGNVRRNKIYTSAHRVSWELTFGPIPKGMQVQHSCDNPSCCNPNHLMLGTVVSNYVDMVRKGRGNSTHKNRLFGTRNLNHKLSTAEVEEIRAAYKPGLVKQSELAAQYRVSQRTISIITRREGRNHG